jgi:glyoxylase-like metal-dependent hydrolase (beta-lactamase superfamily II)
MGNFREIYDNIYQIGGSNISHPADCSIYLVKIATAEFVMIDCGAGESVDGLVNNIRTIGLDPNGLKALILTHCHIDHIGAAHAFKNQFDCEIIAHQLDSEAIEGRDLTSTAADWYDIKYQPVKIDRMIMGERMTIRLGQVKFECIHTPGHTPGSISVFCDLNGTKVLFGQDIHGPFDPSFGSNIDHWKISMNKLLDMNPDILCEGHYGVFQPKVEVRRYIEGYISKY